MSSFILPQHHPRQRRGRLYESVVSACIRRAGLVTVPSESVKADILRLVSGVKVENVRAIPCGIDDVFHPRNLTEIAPVLQRLGLAAPYILYVGVIDPRKNVPLLIDSFLELAAQGFPEHLVVAGGESWLPNELSTNERVYRTGYIAEADLPFVYAGAALFVYPSLLEGFGFPPLEAMASGVPVVASNTSSLRENLAGAATLVSPNHKPELVAAMRMLLTDFEARANAIAEGKKRAQSFRWERFAEETLACYQALM